VSGTLADPRDADQLRRSIERRMTNSVIDRRWTPDVARRLQHVRRNLPRGL